MYRPSDVWFDRNSPYKVFINERLSGEIWAAQTMTFDARPGEHTVRTWIDFMGSNNVTASLKDFRRPS